MESDKNQECCNCDKLATENARLRDVISLMRHETHIIESRYHALREDVEWAARTGPDKRET